MIIITVARKPLTGTVASNVLRYGCGGLNIDGCRIATDPDDNIYAKNPHTVGTIGAKGIYGEGKPTLYQLGDGRWPANVILSNHEEVVSEFPDSTSTGGSGDASMGALGKTKYGKYALNVKAAHIGGLGDSGSAARFFKQVKE